MIKNLIALSSMVSFLFQSVCLAEENRSSTKTEEICSIEQDKKKCSSKVIHQKPDKSKKEEHIKTKVLKFREQSVDEEVD